MAFYCQHDPQPGDVAYGGNNDGTSWEHAFQNYLDLKTAMNASSGSTGYIKEHDGIEVVARDSFDVTQTLHCGFDAALTGISAVLSERTGYTNINYNDGLLITAPLLLTRCMTECQRSGDVFYVTGVGFLELKDCSIFIHLVDWSSGFALDYTNILATNCSFEMLGTPTSYSYFILGQYGTTMTFKNCIFKNITCNVGFEVEYYGVLSLVGCTFVGMTILSFFSLINNGTFYMANTIIYSCTGSIAFADGQSILYSNMCLTIPGSGHDVTGTIYNEDPIFIGTGDYPYKLSIDTPDTIKLGGSTGVTNYLAYDLLNIPRSATTPSMGCYEYFAGEITYDVLLKIVAKALSDFSPIEGATIRVYADAGGPMTEGETVLFGYSDSSGILQTTTFPYTADQPVIIEIRKASTPPFYRPALLIGTVPRGGLSVTSLMVDD